MNTEKNAYFYYEENAGPQQSGSFRNIIGEYLYHWPLFVLFLLISVTGALIYLHYATPAYTVRARLLIKDSEKGIGAETALKELNLFKSNTVVENELEVLKSRSLLNNVVQDLKLWVQYQGQDNLKYKDLYDKSPVRLTLLTPLKDLESASIEITIKDKKSFILKHKNSESLVSFNSKLRSRFGTWKLDPSEHLPLYEGKKIKISINPPDKITDQYEKSLNVVLTNKKATVVELSIRETTPQRGKDVLNKLIEAYNSAAINDKNRVRQSTLNFIDKRLSSLTGELTSVEKNVEDFKSSRGLIDISSESKFFLENVKDIDSKLNEVNVQLEVVNGIEAYINSSQNTGHAPATTGISDPGLVALINQLINLELKKEQLLETAPEGSPVFEALNRQISGIKHSIRENIKGIKNALVTSRKQLQNFNSNFEASIKKLPGQEREFITIKRQQSIKEELYVYLLQKREEAAVSYASTIADSRTVDQAFYGSPDSPDKTLILGIAAIIGLLFPTGIIYGRGLLNNRILTSKEIQEATSVPVLAELAYQKSNSPVVIKDKSRRMIAEQFRSLRTNLEYIYAQKKEGRVTLLTSGMSGEGKSFVSCNLGAALAATGRKTVILELDLRSPMISNYLQLSNDVGISDYLNDKAYKEKIVKRSDINENLYIASAGSLPEFPTELLIKPQMQELIDWLSINFDEILIDTPPIRLVADAMILSKYSDVNLFVVRHGYTYKSHLDFIKQLFREQKLRNLNIVFNGINSSEQSSNYHYGYYDNKDITKKELMEAGVRDFFKRF
ncbi:GumC family protein [Pararcticibacter amylolyticus]|uniref:Capsular biosynthesis protein n=1 Tax=Pararcticibacter amylolyticus TaxID=2173175 RepID=A0A2U2PBN6_9SPHI|nr:tyrosine-protein kinase [Pararcticibacter amylolyticus]PWG78811.1 capsular biosynthesis protein [Pararcticibacter amylolyticus]